MNRRQQRAFTLIEIVVSLALIGLIALATFESLRFAQRTHDKVARGGAASWEIFAAQRLVRSLIESADPPELEGRREGIALTAAAPLAAGGEGLFRYELALHESRGRKDVLIRWRPEHQHAGRSAEEVLIENVAGVEWAFLEGSGWRAEWLERRRLPLLVRMRVLFPSGDSRQWPDLVAATRITADANCVFDVVARQCRAST